jgi:carbon monoxide dehydrogenase subunit G
VRIEAAHVVAATPEAVFRFLSDLENHWKLAGRWVEPLELNHSSGRVRMHGPLGLRRTATTTVVDAKPSSLMHGTAELSGGTRADIAWELNEDANGTSVRLSAEIDRASFADRALLAIGGRAWMRRRFHVILERLAQAVT